MGHYRSETHLSAAGPPAPVLGDRRHTLRRKLRLYCISNILHRVFGERMAFKGGQPLVAPSRHSPILIRGMGATHDGSALSRDLMRLTSAQK